jgi:hypothetical protein
VSLSPVIAPSPIPSEQLPSTEAPGITVSPSTPPIYAPTPVQPAAPAPAVPNSSAVCEDSVATLRRPPGHRKSISGDRNGVRHDGNGAPKGKWMETLGTKSSAWDALIHGSFS